MAVVKLFDLRGLDRNDWLQLQAIARLAYTEKLDRPQVDINALLEWEDPERYYQSHRVPNSEVGHRYNSHQSLTDQHVAISLGLHEQVGFSHAFRTFTLLC